jgi:hypothetical protein
MTTRPSFSEGEDEMEGESEHDHGIDWRLQMTDEFFMQINHELGPPASTDQEFMRYQIAREAANEFWDWIAARGPERPVDWRARNDRMLSEIHEAAMAKARNLR